MNENAKKEKPSKGEFKVPPITKETTITMSIGAIIALVGGLIPAGVYVWQTQNSLVSIRHSMDINAQEQKFVIEGLITRIDQQSQQIEALKSSNMADRWTATDMKLWSMQLKAINPEMNIPEPLHED